MSLCGIYGGNGDGVIFDKVNIDIVLWYGVGFKLLFGLIGWIVVINICNGDINIKGVVLVVG